MVDQASSSEMWSILLQQYPGCPISQLRLLSMVHESRSALVSELQRQTELVCRKFTTRIRPILPSLVGRCKTSLGLYNINYILHS